MPRDNPSEGDAVRNCKPQHTADGDVRRGSRRGRQADRLSSGYGVTV